MLTTLSSLEKDERIPERLRLMTIIVDIIAVNRNGKGDNSERMVDAVTVIPAISRNSAFSI